MSALRAILSQAESRGLVEGSTEEMAEQFSALLWGSLLVNLLLQIAEPPTLEESLRRARAAATAFMRLHPQPNMTCPRLSELDRRVHFTQAVAETPLVVLQEFHHRLKKLILTWRIEQRV